MYQASTGRSACDDVEITQTLHITTPSTAAHRYRKLTIYEERRLPLRSTQL